MTNIDAAQELRRMLETGTKPSRGALIMGMAALVLMDHRKETGGWYVVIQETVERLCAELYGKTFDEMTPDERADLLRRLNDAAGNEEGGNMHVSEKDA